jgi:hypothetical protein
MNFDDLLRGHLLIHRASVFKWFDYTFGNGDSKDKFFITLNCSINDFPINAVLPTSQHDNHLYFLATLSFCFFVSLETMSS